MEYNFTEAQKRELEQIGELFRQTIYNSYDLLDAVYDFGNELKGLNGDISSNIVSEVFRFHKLISSDYFPKMKEWIGELRNIISEELPKEYFFYITCRQKAWESALRKILKYYFEGTSIILPDIVALRIIIDSNVPEEEQKEKCHLISEICIKFFMQQMCTLMPPSKQVSNNHLIKDYINYPKPNGYQSIHLAFMDILNNIFEVQIRTQQMDFNAEYGLKDYDENDENDENDEQNGKSLNHNDYKDSEYGELTKYIFFDPNLVHIPLFRYYEHTRKGGVKEEILTDKIGLKCAKPIDYRADTTRTNASLSNRF